MYNLTETLSPIMYLPKQINYFVLTSVTTLPPPPSHGHLPTKPIKAIVCYTVSADSISGENVRNNGFVNSCKNNRNCFETKIGRCVLNVSCSLAKQRRVRLYIHPRPFGRSANLAGKHYPFHKRSANVAAARDYY